MRVTINDNEVIIPSSLSEITLGQSIALYKQHGKELDEIYDSIMKMEEGIDKEMEILEFSILKMFKTVSFFSGIPVEALKESAFIDDIFSIYQSSLSVLFEDERELEHKTSFIFKDQEWELAPVELKQGSKMTFGEFIDAKQLVKDMSDLGSGRWEMLQKLCAVYLRKKDEKYREEFVYEDSERLKLMEELPMDIALQVGFFLTATMNLFQNTFMYLEKAELKEAESILKAISTNTAG